MDIIFLIDIIVNFNSAIETNDYQIIDDRKTITKIYVKGWFMIDIVAILPFDKFLSAGNVNGLVRVARIGKLYKLVKITRLVRLFKVIKQ